MTNIVNNIELTGSYSGFTTSNNLSTVPRLLGQKEYPTHVSKIPRHGENIVSATYLPPILMFFPFSAILPVISTDQNDFDISFNDQNEKFTTLGSETGSGIIRFKFIQEPSSHNLYEYLEYQFAYQYGVTVISSSAEKIIYSLNGKSYESFAIIQTDTGKIPNMLIDNDPYDTLNYILPTMRTYRYNEDLYGIMGTFGTGVGKYFSFTASKDIGYSLNEFDLPSTQYILGDSEIVTDNSVNQRFKKNYTQQSVDFNLQSPYSDYIKFKPVYSKGFVEFKKTDYDIYLGAYKMNRQLIFQVSHADEHVFASGINFFELETKPLVSYITSTEAEIYVNGLFYTLSLNTPMIINTITYTYTNPLGSSFVVSDGTNTYPYTITSSKPDETKTINILFADMFSQTYTRQLSNTNFEYLSKTFSSTVGNYIQPRIIRPEETKLIKYLRSSDENDVIMSAFVLDEDDIFYRRNQRDDPSFVEVNFILMGLKVYTHPQDITTVDIENKIVDGEYTNDALQTFTIQNSIVDVSKFPFETNYIRFLSRPLSWNSKLLETVLVSPEILIERLNEIKIQSIVSKENIDFDVKFRSPYVVIENIRIPDINIKTTIILKTDLDILKFETNVGIF